MLNAFLFPGQGSQRPGMGYDLYQDFYEAHLLLDEACDALGFDLKAIMFESPEEKLNNTRYAQLAIYVCSAMYLALAKEKGIPFQYVAGHSLGEYSALYAAGAISYIDGLFMVNKRAKLMADENGKGTMTVVFGLDEKELSFLIEKIPDIVISNLCTPKQIVVSGGNRGIERMEGALESRNINYNRLRVSSAFHSHYMEKAAAEMSQVISNIQFIKPRVKIVLGATTSVSESISEIMENVIMQMVKPVRWYDCVLYLKGIGVERFYEIGYGHTLAKINKDIIDRPECFSV